MLTPNASAKTLMALMDGFAPPVSMRDIFALPDPRRLWMRDAVTGLVSIKPESTVNAITDDSRASNKRVDDVASGLTLASAGWIKLAANAWISEGWCAAMGFVTHVSDKSIDGTAIVHCTPPQYVFRPA